MALARIDELNNLRTEIAKTARNRKFRDYFDFMVLTEEAKNQRVELADSLEVITAKMYSLAVSLHGTMADEDLEDYLLTFYINRIFDELDSKNVEVKTDTVQKFARDIVHTTMENKSEWFTSSDRAFNNSVDLANIFLNESENLQAIKEGKTQKRWHTMLDDKVRDTHIVLEGTTIPINALYDVGMYQMRYPMDSAYGASASEIAGCRCSIEYL